MAYFRADLCLYSPESYTLEEKRDICNDMMSTSTLLDTYYATSVELDTSRDSVSSVDLNDEAMNLMQYSQSYNAACRLMTTLDSLLDKLINGTGITL